MFRRLHPRFKTPWLSLLVFAGFLSILFIIPGNVDFIGRMYAFGAMLSFTVAHAAVVQLRRRPPEVEEPYHVPPSIRIGKVNWPLFAILGGLGTAAAWLVVVVQDAPTRYAGLIWLAVGFAFYVLLPPADRRAHHRNDASADSARPAIALEYRTILVPIVSGTESHEAIDLAARLSAERGATIVALRVIVVPLDQPLDCLLPEEEAEADKLLDDARAMAETYGVRTVDRIVRARNAGRAIVEEAERRQAEIIVLGAPRGRHRDIFGKTVDYVLKNAPCRVMVAAGKKAA